MCGVVFFFFKQKTAYEVGTGDWSSDVCSSDLKFPTSLHGHIPDHGPFPLHLQAIIGSPHSCLLVACNDYIARLKLGLYQKPIDDIPRTHYAPLCGAIYNQFFREVHTVISLL